MKDLDQILNDEQPNDEPQEPVAEQPQAEAQPAPEQPEQPQAAEPVRDEKGRFAPKGVETGTPPVPDKLPQEEFKAIKDERTKRQNLEHEVQALRQQLQQLQQPQGPPPSVWDDEQAWQQHFGSKVVSAAVEQASLNATLNMSEMMVRQANPDFDDVKAEFLAMAEQNPALVQQALADPHPWQRAYQTVKNHRTMQELGATDLDALKAKLREEIAAELQAQQPALPSAPAFPATISNERNVGQRSGPAWSGPASLADILR